jgi:antitoxin component YwqK of YwqJK toxin-antitoxin module
MVKATEPKEHRQYHRDGSLWATGQMLDEQATGYWEWFRKDGTKMRSGYFEAGKQVGTWMTYDRNGDVYKITRMKSGKPTKPQSPRDASDQFVAGPKR